MPDVGRGLSPEVVVERSPISAALFAADHETHDVGWRHENGRLYSATCHDCGARFVSKEATDA